MTLLDELTAAQTAKSLCRVAEFIKTLEPKLGAELLDVIDNHPEISKPTILRAFSGITRDNLGRHRAKQCPCWKT